MSLFLSKVTLKKPAARDLANVKNLLWRLFPNMDGEPRPFLYRLGWADDWDWKYPGKEIPVFMQSCVEPSPSRNNGVSLVAKKPFSPVLKEGQLLGFSVVASPSKDCCVEGKNKSIRKYLRDPEEQLEWLLTRLNDSEAVDVRELRLTGNRTFFYTAQKKRRQLFQVSFEGVFTVRNPENLLEMMEKGIGRQKAYGSGLLSLYAL